MTSIISNEFLFFVKCIEGNGDLHQHLVFADAQELKLSMKHFFERAARNIELVDIFARQADRLKFVYPSNEKHGRCTNLRKTLVNETRDQLRRMVALLSSDRCVDADLAKGSYKFFGELFNIGFIFPAILLREIQLLERLIRRSSVSHECLILLIQTVTMKILDTPDDHTFTQKQLIEFIVKPECNQMPTKVKPVQTVRRTTSEGSTSGYSTSDSEEDQLDAENDTAENYDPLALKTPEDNEILGKCEVIFCDLAGENVDDKLMELVTFMHENPKKVQMIASFLIYAATRDMDKAKNCVTMLKKLETHSEESKSFCGTITAFIARFYEKKFIGPCLVSGEPSDDKNVENLKSVRFLCELYQAGVINKSFVFEVITGFLKADCASTAAVSFVVELMTAIGSQLEAEKCDRIEKYFAYIQYAVNSEKETNFRHQEYTKLIEFRKNGWKASEAVTEPSPVVQHEKPPTFTLQFEDLDNEDNLFGIALKLRSFVRTAENAEAIIKALLGHSTIDFKRIEGIASLIKKLSEIRLYSSTNSLSINIGDIVVNFLNEGYVETSAVKTLGNVTEQKLTRLVAMASELFQRNVISAVDLTQWLFHKHLYQLPLVVLSQVSAIVSSTPKANDNKTLSMAIGLLETEIGEISSTTFANMHDEVSELSNLVVERLNAKKQPRT